jgi:biopolymer transport protein ExbB
MKRLFPILAITFMMAFGSVSATTNTSITAMTIVNPLQNDTSSDDVESLGFHQELKKRFIEGGPWFYGNRITVSLFLGLQLL